MSGVRGRSDEGSSAASPALRRVEFARPQTSHTFVPNLQIVTINTPEGKVRLKVTTSVMSSRNFQDYLTGIKPLPKELTKKSRQHLKKH